MTIKYTGDGAYFVGIPARDLTDDEFSAMPEVTQRMLLDSGIYEQASAPRAKKTATAVEPTVGITPGG